MQSAYVTTLNGLPSSEISTLMLTGDNPGHVMKNFFSDGVFNFDALRQGNFQSFRFESLSVQVG
jgi:hypothetical protein